MPLVSMSPTAEAADERIGCQSIPSAVRSGVVKLPLGLPAATDRVPGFFVRRPAPLSLAFVPELLAFGQG